MILAEVISLIVLYSTKLALYWRMNQKIAVSTIYAIMVVVVYGCLAWMFRPGLDNPNLTRASQLLGVPLTLLLIPTLSFLWDLFVAREPRSLVFVGVRSIIEIVFFLLVWRQVMFRIEVALGWRALL